MTENDISTLKPELRSPGLDLDAVQQLGDQRVAMVIEDDPDTLNLLKLNLRRAGINVVGAIDGKQAIKKWMDASPNVVILDLMMPEMDGWETLAQLRAMSDAPIIILSALTQSANIVRGLREGADDYITKPFQNEEIIARVEAALRRAGPQVKSQRMFFPELDLVVDLETHQVVLKSEFVELTPREFSVLAVLAKNHPKPVTYAAIAVDVWDEDNDKILWGNSCQEYSITLADCKFY